MTRDSFNQGRRATKQEFGDLTRAAEANDAGGVDGFLDQWDDGGPGIAAEKLRALQAACVQGAVEAGMTLIRRGAPVNAKTNGGWSPLRTAAYHGQTRMARGLLDRGADIDLQDNLGWTALMLAADAGNEELAALLLGRGAGLDQQQYAMKKNAREIAEEKASETGDADLGAARLRIAAMIRQEESARVSRPFTGGTDKPVAVHPPVRFRS